MANNIQKRYLLAVVLIPLIVIGFGAYWFTEARGGLAFVACDKSNLAFAKDGVPWVMTPEGPRRGDQPGGSQGRQMTCAEVSAEFK